jgi:hypothetical protein
MDSLYVEIVALKRAYEKETAPAKFYAPIFLAEEPRFGSVQGSGQTI